MSFDEQGAVRARGAYVTVRKVLPLLSDGASVIFKRLIPGSSLNGATDS